MLQSTSNYSTTRSQLATPVAEGRRHNWITHCQPPIEDRELERGDIDKIPRVRTPFQVIKQGWRTLLTDFQIIFERDPAARNRFEVLVCYPGLQALISHRLAHWLHRQRVPFLPRFLSQLARFFTGIEIHPGAVMGKGVFIDHGMGVVIGETAIVGDYCLIYQGATLGGTGKETGKRHPTLGKNVVVSAGAKVLGNIHIGDHVRIGAGSVVLGDVPTDCTVVGVPGRIVRQSGKRIDPLEHGQLPDTQAAALRALRDRITELEQQLDSLSRREKQDEKCLD
jgi:serine O-acetyltransferase